MQSGTDNAEAYTGLGQTAIKGYAIALTDVSPTEQTINEETSVSDHRGQNGWQKSADFLIDITGAGTFATAYNTWTAANPISGGKVSGWYIPEVEQLSAWLGMLYETMKASPQPAHPSSAASSPLRSPTPPPTQPAQCLKTDISRQLVCSQAKRRPQKHSLDGDTPDSPPLPSYRNNL